MQWHAEYVTIMAEREGENMPKGKKKRRQRKSMPPLSLLDKCIYWLLGVLMTAALVGLLWGWYIWRERVQFGDEQVVCIATHWSMLWVAVPMFCLPCTALGLWCGLYYGGQPIFGIPGFRYGPPYPRIYPLFMKNRPKPKPRERRGMRTLAAILVGVNLVCVAIGLLSIQGRDSLYRDGSVREVNMFGGISGEYSARDAEQVVLAVYSYKSGRSSSSLFRSGRERWSVRLELQMTDGERFEFNPGGFRGDEEPGEVRTWLRELELVLGQYPAQSIHRVNTQDLDRAVRDLELNEAEIAVLMRLFGQSE